MKKIHSLKEMIVGCIAVLLVVQALTGTVHAASSYTDVREGHWASSSIEKLKEKIAGYPDGTFRPNREVTRAEFAVFLARMIEGQTTTRHSFRDVSNSHWASPAINEGISLGFIDPADFPYGKFEPSKPMTRVEVAKWFTNGLSAVDSGYGEAIDTLANSSKTLIPIPEFYKGGINKSDLPYIGVALGTKLMGGYPDGTFKPNNTTTRAEVAVMLNRLLGAIQKSPQSYTGLNELVEVAETGTNITSITKYEQIHKNDFNSVLGKPAVYKNNIGTAEIKRMIVVDSSTSNIKGIYKDMFHNTKTQGQFDGWYTIYTEVDFTPYIDATLDNFYMGTTNEILAGSNGDYEASQKYGYNTPQALENHSYFTKGQTKNVWFNGGSIESASGSIFLPAVNNNIETAYKID